MFKAFKKLLNIKGDKEKFGEGSNINLNYLDSSLSYRDYVAEEMNALYECSSCELQYRRGYQLLYTKDEDSLTCPCCDSKHTSKKILDMDIVNINLVTAPKYSKSESVKIKQMIFDYKVSKANDKQLENYIKFHQNKLNDMYDKAINTLEEVK